MFSSSSYGQFVCDESSERSVAAQALHTAVIFYIDSRGCPKAAANLTRVLNDSSTTVSTITERSSNGYGLMHDIFSLTMKRCADDLPMARHLSATMFDIVMNICEKRKLFLCLNDLLLSATNEDEITPLHEVLKSGSHHLIKDYLHRIESAVDAGYIKKVDYRDYLVGINKNGYSHLVSAIMSGKVKNLQTYLYAVQHALINEIIDKNDYFNMLTQEVLLGTTLLHVAANTNCLEMVRAVFNLLEDHLAEQRSDLIATFLMKENRTNGALPACKKPDYEGHSINNFLDNMREKYCSDEAEDCSVTNGKRNSFSTDEDVSRKLKKTKTMSFKAPSPKLFDHSRARELARAKELLDCCIDGDRPRIEELIAANPAWMFVTVVTKDINGEQIKISPLRYVIKNHNYYQYRIMRDGAIDHAEEFVRHARSQTDFLDTLPLTEPYTIYNYYQLQYELGGLNQKELQKIWAIVVGASQRFKMPREMLQVMCGTQEKGECKWSPDSNFDGKSPQFGCISRGVIDYENENDYTHFYQEELGRDFAYYRDENNELKVSVPIDTICPINCAAARATIEKYASVMREKIDNSLSRLELKIQIMLDRKSRRYSDY